MEPELRKILGGEPKVAEVVRGLKEARGPAYSRRGYLLFCDVGSGQILKWQDGAAGVLRSAAGAVRSLTFDHQGRLLVCETGGVKRLEKNGSVTGLAGQPEPADIVYAIDGNIYFCTAAAVYRVSREGRAIIASAECEHPVGIALSPNQQSLYVADAGRNNLRVFGITADGALEKGRVFAAAFSGGLGGLKTDEEGRLWVTEVKGVSVFSRGGKPLGFIPIPRAPNNLNWAEGFHDLFVTAGASIYRIEARTNGTRTY